MDTGKVIALTRKITKKVGNTDILTTSVNTDLVSAVNSLNPQFSATPVYEVTFEEAFTPTSTSPYTITAEQLGGDYRELLMRIEAPQAPANSNLRMFVEYSNSMILTAGVNSILNGSNAINSNIRIANDHGVALVVGCASSAIGNIAHQPTSLQFIGHATISSVKLWILSTGSAFPANTKITIYAAK